MNLHRRDLFISGAGIAAALSLRAQNSMPAAPRPGTGSPDTSAYAALRNERKIGVINLRELEDEARKILPPYSYAYISGGAGDEWTMRENESAYNQWAIEPRYLAGVKAPDLATAVLGSTLSLPVITAPMGGQGIAHALKEIPNVKGTASAGTLYVNSSVSHASMEEIAGASPGPKWFQIYFPADRAYARELLERAKSSGFTAIVLTVDGTTFSNRERVMRLGMPAPNLGTGNGVRTPGIDPGRAAGQKADLDWDDVAYCQKVAGLPVLVKGVLTPSLAVQCMKRGCAGVWVSNHGGRGMDNLSPPVCALPRIADALAGSGVIVLDGGIRRGQDVFRALALGANVVALGRPVLYAMALGGAQGVEEAYARLREELRMVMQLAGTASIGAISGEYVRRVG